MNYNLRVIKMSQLRQHDRLIFKNNRGEVVDHKNVERSEQLDAYMFVPKDATVLELGARWGTVSCMINRMLKDPRKHLAVEPDATVIPALIDNKKRAKAQFIIWNGAVSKKPLRMDRSEYDAQTIPAKDGGNVKVASLSQLQQKYKMKFDVLVADCEGCLCSFFKENDPIQFRMIMFEKDYPQSCDYKKIDRMLAQKGFVMIKNELNVVERSVWVRTDHLGFRITEHKVGHGHLGLFGRIGYETSLDTEVNAPEGWIPISAHGPSRIVLELGEEMEIRGHTLPSAAHHLPIEFVVDGTSVDELREVKLSPGRHTLGMTGGNGAHTVWLLKECKK